MGVFPVIAISPKISVDALVQNYSPKWHVDPFPIKEDLTPIIKIGEAPFRDEAEEISPPSYQPPDGIDNSYYRIYRGWPTRCNESDIVGLAPLLSRRPASLRTFLIEKLDAGELTEIESEAISEDESNAPSVLSEEATVPHTSSLKLKAQAETKYARKLLKETTLQSSLVALSLAMNLVFDDHGEITDTEIREQMFDVIFQGFIHQTPGYVVPETFDADSPEGDAAIRAVLTAFLKVAVPLATREGVDTPEKRLVAFYSDSSLELDEFFGWMDHLKPLKN